MKFSRRMFVIVAVCGMILSLCSLSFAEKKHHSWKEEHAAKIKALRDSAATLQQSNPDLAKGLTDLADKEEKQMQELKEAHDAKVKLLNDSIAALQKTNPDLAKELEKMKEEKYKKGKGKEKQGCK